MPVGSKFWKSGKVIRAFLSSNYEALAAEDDDDFRTTDRSAEHHKRRKLSQTPKASDDMRQSDMLDSMNDELTVLRYRVKALEDRISDLDSKKRAANVLKQIFLCLVCQETAYKENVCISTCCEVVLGHQTCIDRWLVQNAICPHCRANHDLESTDSGPAYKFIPTIKPLQCLLNDYVDLSA